MSEPAAPGIRWTIGDVSARGFQALRLSIWGAWRVFGAGAAYAVCVNTISARQARERTGPLPPGLPLRWIEVRPELPPFLEAAFGRDMAGGMAWKLAPLQLFTDRHELALDNDCLLWRMPGALQAWLAAAPGGGQCLLAQDVVRCYAGFDGLAPRQAFNAGIRGLPPGFDLAAALRAALARREQELGAPPRLAADDEQGLQATALSVARPLAMVPLADVTVCSPFHPHLPHLGACGAHFVGLNAHHIAWNYYDRPADEWLAQHWQRHRAELQRRTGTPAAVEAATPG